MSEYSKKDVEKVMNDHYDELSKKSMTKWSLFVKENPVNISEDVDALRTSVMLFGAYDEMDIEEATLKGVYESFNCSTDAANNIVRFLSCLIRDEETRACDPAFSNYREIAKYKIARLKSMSAEYEWCANNPDPVPIQNPQPEAPSAPKKPNVRISTKHYVLAYVFDKLTSGEFQNIPRGTSTGIHEIGKQIGGEYADNTFYRNYNRIISMGDVFNSPSKLVEQFGEHWREIVRYIFNTTNIDSDQTFTNSWMEVDEWLTNHGL